MLNAAMDKIVTEYLNSHVDEMATLLQAMVRIPSVTGEAAEGAPFGVELRRMLDFALKTCAEAGLEVRDIDGYAGDATWGNGDEVVATLSHLDVVPAGEGWTMEPFCGDLIDGRVYGRGSDDNKAAFVEVLYAIRALKEAGFEPKRAIRMIFGCDEESGMSDMKYYVQHVDQIPVMAFSPDSGFPVTYAEKCLMGGSVLVKYDAPTAIRKLRSGTRTNVVPFSASAEVALPIEQLPCEEHITCTEKDGYVLVEAAGKSAHAAWAHDGINAFGRLMAYLDKVLPAEDGARKLTGFYVAKIGMETGGESLGVACTDDVAGPLTHNVGVIDGCDKGCRLQFDIRQPVLCDPEITVAQLKKVYAEADIEVEDIHYSPALYVAKDHPLIKTLMGVYQDLTGDMTEPQAMGGGTYARSLPCAVAFGPGRPGSGNGAHQADEWAAVALMPDSARIFAHALAELSTVEL